MTDPTSIKNKPFFNRVNKENVSYYETMAMKVEMDLERLLRKKEETPADKARIKVLFDKANRIWKDIAQVYRDNKSNNSSN